MKWLKRKLRKWVREEDIYPVEKSAMPIVRNGVDVDGLNFNVMPATGGTIVQIRHYDHKTDRNNNRTHVIPEGEDIAERIGQIVSMELLRA